MSLNEGDLFDINHRQRVLLGDLDPPAFSTLLRREVFTRTLRTNLAGAALEAATACETLGQREQVRSTAAVNLFVHPTYYWFINLLLNEGLYYFLTLTLQN